MKRPSTLPEVTVCVFGNKQSLDPMQSLDMLHILAPLQNLDPLQSLDPLQTHRTNYREKHSGKKLCFLKLLAAISISLI